MPLQSGIRSAHPVRVKCILYCIKCWYFSDMGHTCLLPAVVDKAASMLKTASVVIGQTRYLLFLSEQGPLLIALLYSALTAPYIYK